MPKIDRVTGAEIPDPKDNATDGVTFFESPEDKAEFNRRLKVKQDAERASRPGMTYYPDPPKK
jgi:hypothetical protein